MTATAKTGVKRPRSSRLRLFRCFTAVDDEESCSQALDDHVAVKETNGGGVRRLSDLRPSSPVTQPRQKKRFWIFSGVADSISPDSSPAKKKHWRRKRGNGELSQSSKKQDTPCITTNSNNTIGSWSSSSFSTNKASLSSSEADLSSTSSSSTTCVSTKHNKIIVDSGLCVLVVSLLVVVVWGKVCAIVCTSTWLCIIMFGRPIKPQIMSSVSDP